MNDSTQRARRQRLQLLVAMVVLLLLAPWLGVVMVHNARTFPVRQVQVAYGAFALALVGAFIIRAWRQRDILGRGPGLLAGQIALVLLLAALLALSIRLYTARRRIQRRIRRREQRTCRGADPMMGTSIRRGSRRELLVDALLLLVIAPAALVVTNRFVSYQMFRNPLDAGGALVFVLLAVLLARAWILWGIPVRRPAILAGQVALMLMLGLAVFVWFR